MADVPSRALSLSQYRAARAGGPNVDRACSPQVAYTGRNSGAVVTLRHYEVTSPEYEQVYDRIMHYDLTAPGVDWMLVEAHTAREAVSIAVKAWLKEPASWSASQKRDALCPFTGVRARLAVCEHGVCWGCGDSEGRTEHPCSVCADMEQRERALEALGDRS